jgi:hypothetical protein
MRGLRRRGQADRAEAGIAALIRNDPSIAATWLTSAIATWFDEVEHRHRANGAADIVQEPTLVKLREPTLMM